ncbi:class F sortase [Actinoplanes sp. URMC 104]|uniref:class F sortase n=1 Tax=Actinoplanes sp. URMC 104 TaxID=3423409 RepID=UPI003F1A525B
MSIRDAGGRRALGLGLLAAGVCALTVGIATLHEPGRVPAAAGTLPAPSFTVPGPASSASAPSVAPSRSATRGARDLPAAVTMPTRVTIGDLDVDAPIDPAGVARDRELRIPEDPSRLGWWIGSARPGEPTGTVLIAGHVDTAADGRGALFELENLKMGARIQVRSGATTHEYRAVARRSYVKSRLPADLFRPATSPRLVLITCGGDFHDGAYSHNVVLYAEPVA